MQALKTAKQMGLFDKFRAPVPPQAPVPAKIVQLVEQSEDREDQKPKPKQFKNTRAFAHLMSIPGYCQMTADFLFTEWVLNNRPDQWDVRWNRLAHFFLGYRDGLDMLGILHERSLLNHKPPYKMDSELTFFFWRLDQKNTKIPLTGDAFWGWFEMGADRDSFCQKTADFIVREWDRAGRPFDWIVPYGKIHQKIIGRPKAWEFFELLRVRGFWSASDAALRPQTQVTFKLARLLRNHD